MNRTPFLAAPLVFTVAAGGAGKPEGEPMPDSAPPGHLARPPLRPPGPGILVLHPWWGLNDAVKDVCERLAGEGFTAFAPDLYHGRIATTVEEAEALSGALLGGTQGREDVALGARFLGENADPETGGIAVVGFSLGAFYALDLSAADPENVRVVVLFYGTRPGDYGSSKAAYLGHFAESDEFEPASEVKNLEKALLDAGRPVEFHTYGGTGHWFFEPDRTDAYRPEAARQAWERTVTFLRKTLSP